VEQALEEVGASLVADAQAAKAQQPGERTLTARANSEASEISS
jgi:hypothetical protein